MPRKSIDYSKTIFYKLQANDVNIDYVYVDFTTNFINKKNAHKKNALDFLKMDNQLYKFIYENGGWYSWTMSEIATLNCKNKEDALSKKKQFEKTLCNLNTSTNNKDDNLSQEDDISLHVKQEKKYFCRKCAINYFSKSGLWRHQKKCNVKSELVGNVNILDHISRQEEKHQSMDTTSLTQLFIDSVKQNQEFQKQMYDLIKDNIGTHNINSHNKTTNNQFNLQFFLNETCKDAMNINEFIDYVKVKIDDFEQFGEIGYPKALGDIIVRNLNELEVHQRPIHCSDLKREVLYIKHDGVWFNDDKREFMKKSIMYIAHKNIKQIPLWQEANPDSKDYHSKTFEKYNKMFRASLGAENDEQKEEYLKKITSIVAKEVVIDKKKKY